MGSFRRLALVTALLAFILIVVGGLVRVSGSGLGCPDWPTCHGQIVPPLVLQSIIEYSHRLTAGLVTIAVVATAIYAWVRFRTYPWVLVPATLAVVLVIVQTALGAFTVALELTPALVTAHLATAMAFLSMSRICANNQGPSCVLYMGLCSLPSATCAVHQVFTILLHRNSRFSRYADPS